MNFDNMDDSLKEAYYQAGREELQQWADDNGFIVKVPTDRELFLDIDTQEQYNLFRKRFPKLCDEMGCSPDYEETPSASGLPHRHIVVTLAHSMNDEGRMFLQLWLGSDPIREYLSFLRLNHSATFPILFLEKR